MGQPGEIDAFTAADNYKRAVELLERAQRTLALAIERDRKEINLKALARRAGLHQQTLRSWMRREEMSANGGEPTAAQRTRTG